jgi:hypothetical protein
MQQVQRMLSRASLPWVVVDKAGSKLSDLETRTHVMLQDVTGWTTGIDTAQVRHISDANGKVWQDHVEIVNGNPHGTDHAALDGIAVLDTASSDATQDRHLSNAQSKVWQDHKELTNSNPHGTDHSQLDTIEQSDDTSASTDPAKHVTNAQVKVYGDHARITNGNPHGTDHDMLDGLADDDHAQYLLLAGRTGQRAVTPLIFGTATNNTTFEEDGTAKFNGSATVWKDIFFPMAIPKTTGAGNPTLTTFLGNLRGYTFAVNDAHDFDPQEFAHDGKEGSTATFHIHFVSRTNVAADRAVKFQLEYSQANRNGVFPAPTTVSAEIVIPANTTANTHIVEDIATFTTGNIAGQMFVRLTRISAAGTAPADDPVVIGVHYHYELDTVGSRLIFTK